MSLRDATKTDILSFVIKDIAYLIFYTMMCTQCFKIDESSKNGNRKTQLTYLAFTTREKQYDFIDSNITRFKH